MEHLEAQDARTIYLVSSSEDDRLARIKRRDEDSETESTARSQTCLRNDREPATAAGNLPLWGATQPTPHVLRVCGWQRLDCSKALLRRQAEDERARQDIREPYDAQARVRGPQGSKEEISGRV